MDELQRVVVSDLMSEAGITATRTIGELLDTAALLHTRPLPNGTRVAVVSNAGGVGVLAADACAEAGFPSVITDHESSTNEQFKRRKSSEFIQADP